jgi:hypothetical protein
MGNRTAVNAQLGRQPILRLAGFLEPRLKKLFHVVNYRTKYICMQRLAVIYYPPMDTYKLSTHDKLMFLAIGLGMAEILFQAWSLFA